MLDRHDQPNFRRPELKHQLELFQQKNTTDDDEVDDYTKTIVILPSNDRD